MKPRGPKMRTTTIAVGQPEQRAKMVSGAGAMSMHVPRIERERNPARY